MPNNGRNHYLDPVSDKAYREISGSDNMNLKTLLGFKPGERFDRSNYVVRAVANWHRLLNS